MKKNLLTLSLVIVGLSLLAQTPRLSLYEEFTGETCPPCASTNPGLNALLLSATNATKIVAIKWQVPIPSAPSKPWSLYQTNKAEIDWRYKAPTAGYGYASQANAAAAITSQGVNSAPSGRIDGQHQWVFGATSDHPATMNNSVISNAQSVMSPFSVTMNRAWDKSCSSVNLTITIQATAPFTAVGALKFRTVMVERTIQFATQPGTNGETKFEDVAIKSFPTIQNGVPMASNWIVGQSQTFTLNCPLPSYTRKKDEVAFVGFIQDDGDKKVAQACRADKDLLPDDAVAGIKSNVGVTCNNQISPVVDIKNEGTLNPITNLTLTPVVDGVAGTPTFWTGTLLPGATTPIALTGVTTPTVSGNHTFSVNIDMGAPLYNLTQNTTRTNYVVAGNFQGNPVSEGFVLGTFPPAGWASINPDAGPSWTRVTNAGAYLLSYESTRYDFYSNTNIGDVDEFFLPPIDLSGTAAPELSYDWSYAQKTNTSNDMFEIYVSDNCGANWTNVYTGAGTSLATTSPLNGSPFIPTSLAEWQSQLLTLTGFNKPNVLVKFVTTNDNGNNLFIDNVNLVQKSPVKINAFSASSANVVLFPNPSNGATTLNIEGVKAGNAKISVINTLGQVVFEKQTTLTEGSNSIQIDAKEYAAGIYNVTVDTNDGSIVKKLTVTK